MLKYSAHDNINMLRVLFISHRLKDMKRERERNMKKSISSLFPLIIVQNSNHGAVR